MNIKTLLLLSTIGIATINGMEKSLVLAAGNQAKVSVGRDDIKPQEQQRMHIILPFFDTPCGHGSLLYVSGQDFQIKYQSPCNPGNSAPTSKDFFWQNY